MLLLNKCHFGDTKTFINAVAFNWINAVRYKLISRQAVRFRWDKRPAAWWAGLYQEFVPCNGIQILESGKFLYAESGIPENFFCGIQNRGLWKSGKQLKESRIQVPLTILDSSTCMYLYWVPSLGAKEL